MVDHGSAEFSRGSNENQRYDVRVETSNEIASACRDIDGAIKGSYVQAGQEIRQIVGRYIQTVRVYLPSERLRFRDGPNTSMSLNLTHLIFELPAFEGVRRNMEPSDFDYREWFRLYPAVLEALQYWVIEGRIN